jgi:subtilisin family serine protease
MKNTVPLLLVFLCLVLIPAGCAGGGDSPVSSQSGGGSPVSLQSGGGTEYFLDADASAIVEDPDEKFFFVANELFVAVQEGQPASLVYEMASKIGGTVAGILPDEALYQVRFPGNYTWAELEEKADFIESNYPGVHVMVDYFEDGDNYTDYAGEGTDFVTEGNHWGQDAIKLPQAWKYAYDNNTLKKVHIGVVDTGFDVTHEDLAANIDYCSPGKNSMTSEITANTNHGTHVTGIIGAVDNYGAESTGKGLRGVCLTPKLYVYKPKTLSHANIGSALHDAVNDGARVINISIGHKWWKDGKWNTYDGTPPSYLNARQMKIVKDVTEWYESAVKLASKKNCLIVKTAGNNKGIDSFWNGASSLVETYPDNLIIVANANDATGELNSSSQRNIERTYVSVCAPGSEIWSSVPDDKYEWLTGTSMAAPFVTGLAGLMLSVNSKLTAGQMKTIIVKTATAVQGGPPLINALEAVKKAGGS